MGLDPNALKAMQSGLSQRVPLQTLGLAGMAPSAQNPRGGMPGGIDPAAAQFQNAESVLKTLAATLKREGNTKSLQRANEIESMSVKLNSFMIQRQQEQQQQQAAQQQGGGGNFPNVNAGGTL